jgi:hypothetical protein
MAIRKVDAAAFAASHAPLLAQAARINRLTPTVREAILRHAGESAAKGERRISVAARAIAKDVGVSAESVRVLLVKNPAASKGNLVGRKPRAPQAETLAFAAWCRGLGPAQIAEKLGCSQPAADRILHKVRAQFLALHADAFSPKEVEIPTTFARDDAREVILASDAVCNNLCSASPMRDAREWFASKGNVALGSGAQLMAVRFLLWSAQKSTRALPSIRPSEKILDRIETDLRWARLLLRSLLIQSMPLIVTRLKIWSGGEIELLTPDAQKKLLVLCAESLLMVVRESSPANIASGRVRIERAVSQAVERQLISLNPELSASKSILGQPIPTRDPIDVVCPWQISTDALARRVGKISAGAIGRELWCMRIGWDGNAPMTIAQMSQSQGKPISVIAGMLGRAIR